MNKPLLRFGTHPIRLGIFAVAVIGGVLYANPGDLSKTKAIWLLAVAVAAGFGFGRFSAAPRNTRISQA